MITQKLYQLQETEVEIESAQKALDAYLQKLGESDKVIEARSRLSSIQKRLEELEKKQCEIEWSIDDIGAKIHKSNDDLYGGRINNPKELTNLQQEVSVMESKRQQLEEDALEIMAQIENVRVEKMVQEDYLKSLESEWRNEHAELLARIQQLRNNISVLGNKREMMAAEIEPQVLDYYNQLKARKGVAVAKIEQGMCHGCRISLSTAELQRVRVGQIVECSSCHRILYLP
jgi:predicted  nucleic acid-binding Zn-ribbon protein